LARRAIGIDPSRFQEALFGNAGPVHEPIALTEHDASSVAIAIHRQDLPAILDRACELGGAHSDRYPEQPTLRMLCMGRDEFIDHSIGGRPMRIGHGVLDLLGELAMPEASHPEQNLFSCPIGFEPYRRIGVS